MKSIDLGHTHLEKINEINRSWSYSSKIRGGGEEKTQVNKIRK